jgi:hypothetical protein
MVKLPAKFDDISKTAKSVLDDDYKSKGYQCEAKLKTNLDGAILTSTVDFEGKGDVLTPAKLSWKFPKPFGIVGFAIDKFEFDKKGALKLETSIKKDMHKVDGLVVDCKTDCKDPSKATVGLAYTGVKDAFLKFETAPMKFMDFKAECLYGVGNMAIGAQFSGTDVGKANLGCNYTKGDFFASVFAKKKFTEFTGHVYYKPMPTVLLAATANYQTETMAKGKVLSYSFGTQCSVTKEIVAKAKVDSKMEAQGTCKIEVCKGMKATVGGLYKMSSGDASLGVKLVLE